jgi:hypothetical protein
MFAFGSAVRFIPSKVTGDKTEQFSGSTQPGIFMGYGVNSGCIWSGEYLVARAKEFRDMNYHAGQRKGDGKFIVVNDVRMYNVMTLPLMLSLTSLLKRSTLWHSRHQMGGWTVGGAGVTIPMTLL